MKVEKVAREAVLRLIGKPEIQPDFEGKSRQQGEVGARENPSSPMNQISEAQDRNPYHKTGTYEDSPKLRTTNGGFQKRKTIP